MPSHQGFTLEIEHRIGEPPEAVFEYFTDPEKYRRWKGAEAELDPRPGGIYRVMMAPQVWVRGRYVAVEHPYRIVLTWGFESDLPLPRGLGHVASGSTTVEFRFIPDGDGTIVRVRHTGLPTHEARGVHELGWKTYLSRLAAISRGADPGEDPAPTLVEASSSRAATSKAHGVEPDGVHRR